MQKFAENFATCAFLAVIAAGLPWLVLLAWAVFRRRWKSACKLFAGGVVGVLVLYGLVTAFGLLGHAEYLAGVFGTKARLGSVLYEYEAVRELNGDGCSFAVYPLPAEIHSRFKHADKELLSRFPLRPYYRHDWEAKPWQIAAADPELDSKIRWSTSSLPRNQETQQMLEKLDRSARSSSAYVSCFYKRSDGFLLDLDLFVVDLEQGLLFIINQQT
jgi:hypothetical protein